MIFSVNLYIAGVRFGIVMGGNNVKSGMLLTYKT